MDPVIREIYLAYFDRDLMKTVGLPEDVSLASALQNISRDFSLNLIFDPFTFGVPSKRQDITKEAYEFVKKYSTVRHKYGL